MTQCSRTREFMFGHPPEIAESSPLIDPPQVRHLELSLMPASSSRLRARWARGETGVAHAAFCLPTSIPGAQKDVSARWSVTRHG